VLCRRSYVSGCRRSYVSGCRRSYVSGCRRSYVSGCRRNQPARIRFDLRCSSVEPICSVLQPGSFSIESRAQTIESRAQSSERGFFLFDLRASLVEVTSLGLKRVAQAIAFEVTRINRGLEQTQVTLTGHEPKPVTFERSRATQEIILRARRFRFVGHVLVTPIAE
jgi:hypothetical protein